MFDKLFNRAPIVYILALIATAFVSIYDGIKAAGFEISWYEHIFKVITSLRPKYRLVSSCNYWNAHWMVYSIIK